MPSVSSTVQPTTSGITTDEAGQRHIPSSTRPDGSKRKEIKIRPGYRPPEDVEVYKNRTAHAFATRGSRGIPGAEGLKDDKENSKPDGKLSKNAKRREARKKAKTADGEEGPEIIETQQEEGETEEAAAAAADEKPIVLSKEEEDRIENEKKARKLRKKLREARDLQEKKEKGEKLLHEQFEKVIKITELIRDLDKLGFGPDGEPKESLQDG